jgi:hypothetical protein
MRLTLRNIIKSYEIIKKMAFQEFEKGNIEKSLEYIDHSTTLAQQFNWIYADEELENLLKKISDSIFINKIVDYQPIKNRVVVYDDFCLSFVLVLQYINALLKNNFEVLYITGRKISDSTKYTNIIEYLNNTFPNLKIEIIPQSKDRIKRVKQIQEKILAYQPSKLFLHIFANSICIPVLYNLPVGITKYIINLADQTFWLGSKAIDYSFEFRTFGATVSFEKRGLLKSQLLYLPFYPFLDSISFQGFPDFPKNKIIVFSGGDFYKTVDPNFTYWKLIKSLLLSNPDVIFLFATKVETGNVQNFIESFIKKNNFEDQFKYIGFRKDINEVFKRCDIYIGTCPVSGSLMSQLAAFHSKPILQFYLPETYDEETESAICHNCYTQISFTDKNKFLAEASHLIKDANYRLIRGKEINKCLITEEQFNLRFANCLKDNVSPVKLMGNQINYRELANRWYWIEQLKFIDTIQYVYSIIKSKILFKNATNIWLKYIYSRFIQNKILNLEWYKHKFIKSSK